MSGVSLLNPYANFYAKQSRKGCLQTLLGCDANTEIHIATLEDPYHDVFYALEDADWCWRFFCQAVHPFQMTLSQGADAGGPSVAHYERPLRCPVQNCKCCCYQEIYVSDPATGRHIGSITEGFYWCIPTFHVKDAEENITHHIHVPVCFGCCANVCAEGCCRIPFYVYPANDYRYDNFDGKIVKMWGSLFTELIGVHQFQCQFPKAATADQKAVFMGGTFLLNELFFKAGAHSN